jgi:DnaK suppressor protein
MEQEKLQFFKGLLEKRKQEIIDRLDEIGTKAAGAEINFNADFPDYGDSASVEDSASEVSDYTTNLSVEREMEGELRDVEKALKQIGDGTYGVCKYCHKDIEEERLKIRPESTSCVACKKLLKG